MDRLSKRSSILHERVLDAISDPVYRKLIEQKISFNTERSGTCKVWTGCALERGYGYMMVRMVPKVLVSHLVLMLHGIDPHGMMVCHKCDNPACVNVDHLFLGTAASNNLDRVKKGRTNEPFDRAVGSRHGRAKLSDAQVKLIMFLASQGAEQCQIAQWFGVCKSTVGNIFRKEVWKCLEL